MSNVMRQLITERQRIVARDKFSEEDEDVSFHFFDDGSTVNIGIGTEVDPTIRLAHIDHPEPPVPTEPVEPADKVEPQSESEQATQDPEPASLHQDEVNLKSDQVISPTDEIKPNLSIITAAAEEPTISEPDSSSIDVLKEQMSKSAKLFEDTKSHFSSRQINVDLVTTKEPIQFNGSLDIEDEPAIEAVALPSDLEKLEADYDKSKEKVGGLIVDGKVSAADRSGNQAPWVVNTFIVAPIRWLFRALYYHGVRDFIHFIGNLLKFVLIRAVVIVGIYIVIAHYSDSGLSAYEMAMQHYETVKKVVLTLYDDISSEVRGNEGH